MLELTSFQIFFMVVHGCAAFFAIAYLTRGSSSRRSLTHSDDIHNGIISYSKHKKRRQRKRKYKRRLKPGPNSGKQQRALYGKVSNVEILEAESDEEAKFREVYEVS